MFLVQENTFVRSGNVKISDPAVVRLVIKTLRHHYQFSGKPQSIDNDMSYLKNWCSKQRSVYQIELNTYFCNAWITFLNELVYNHIVNEDGTHQFIPELIEFQSASNFNSIKIYANMIYRKVQYYNFQFEKYDGNNAIQINELLVLIANLKSDNFSIYIK